MTKRLVAVRLFDPKATGDAPASGVVECRPTLRRHIEGGDPDDFIVLPAKFTSRLGAALDYIDANDDEQTAEATDGVAWFWIDVTDEGDYADLWAWTFTERTSGGMKRTIQIPTGVGIYEYGDADDLEPDDFTPATPLTPAWTAAAAALQAAIDAVEASDVDSVAGLSGTVSASGLKTALSLPSDTGSSLTALGAADTALGARIDGLIAGAPGALDTLNELAAALGDDANFAATVATALAALTAADTALDGRLDVVEGSFVPQLADAAAVDAYIAALPPDTPYVVIQQSPFDIFQGVS